MRLSFFWKIVGDCSNVIKVMCCTACTALWELCLAKYSVTVHFGFIVTCLCFCVKSNHGGVQGKLPAGLTEVGAEQGSSTRREEPEEEDEEQENNDDMCNDEEDEGVNEHYECKAGVLNLQVTCQYAICFVWPACFCCENVTLHDEK